MLARTLVFSAAAAAVTVAPPASACIGRCASAGVAPVTGFPSNVAGVPVLGDASDFVLLDREGKELASKLTSTTFGLILSPKASDGSGSGFAPGSYGLRWKNGCTREARDLRFSVREAAAVPTASGTLSFRSTSRISAGFPSTDYRIACIDEVDVAVVDLDLVADASLEPYREVLSWETKVDGGSWSSDSPVRFDDTSPQPAYTSVVTATRLFAYCGGAQPRAGYTGLREGSHHVEVRAVVPGLSDIPSATIDVELSCAKAGPAPSSSGSSSGASSGSSSGSSSSSDDASDGSQGCSSSGRSASTLPGWLLALAVGLVAKRKSRRSSASGRSS